MSAEERAAVRSSLISAIATSAPASFLRGVASAIGAAAAVELSVDSLSTGDTGWPELLPALAAAAAASPAAAGCAAAVVEELAPHLAEVSLGAIGAQLAKVVELLLASSDTAVRVRAATATFAALSVRSKLARVLFANSLLAAVGVAAERVTSADWDAATSLVGCAAGLVEAHTQVVRPMATHLVGFAVTALGIAAPASFHAAAAELVLLLAEHMSSRFKQQEGAAKAVLDSAFRWLVDGVGAVDVAAWGACDDPVFAGDGDLPQRGAAALDIFDRLPHALGGDYSAPLLGQLMAPGVMSPEWQLRYAALWALTQAAEACVGPFSRHLPELVRDCIMLGSDPHPMVRHAALHTIAQLCSDFDGEVQTANATAILGLIRARLLDGVHRQRADAALAIVNFVDTDTFRSPPPSAADAAAAAAGAESPARPAAEAAIVGEVMALLPAVVDVLGQVAPSFVPEAMLAAVAAVASVFGAAIRPHLEALMGVILPALASIMALKSASPASPVLLPGAPGAVLSEATANVLVRTLECATHLGNAVRLPAFEPYLRPVLDALQAMDGLLPASDTRRSHLHSSWARMCALMGNDFVPYLGSVIPRLIEAVASHPGVAPARDEEEEGVSGEGSTVVRIAFAGAVDYKVRLRSDEIQERQECLALLNSYLETLGAAAAPFCPAIAHLLMTTEAIQFPYCDSVRISAAQLAASSYRAAALAGSVEGLQALDPVVGLVLQTAMREPEVEAVQSVWQAVRVVLANAPAGSWERSPHLAQLFGASGSFVRQFGSTAGARQRVVAEMGDIEDGDCDAEEQLDVEESEWDDALEAIVSCVAPALTNAAPDAATAELAANVVPAAFALLHTIADWGFARPAPAVKGQWPADNVTARHALILLCEVVEFGRHNRVPPDTLHQMALAAAAFCPLAMAAHESGVAQAAAYLLQLCFGAAPSATAEAMQKHGTIHALADMAVYFEPADAGSSDPAGPGHDDDWAEARCNAVSTLLSLLACAPSPTDPSAAALAAAAVAGLPVVGDDTEARRVYRKIVLLLAGGHPACEPHAPALVEALRFAQGKRLLPPADPELSHAAATLATRYGLV